MAVIKAVSSKAGIGQALDYVTKEEKTEDKLVSGLHCEPDTVKDEMQATKELWGKTGGRTYKHFVQSYHEDEHITPEQAHKNAVELAKNTEAWKGHEVLIATHIDRGHIHTHFIVNSVNYENGHKLQWSKADLQNLKDRCNEQSRQQGLHVPEKGKTFSGEEREETVAWNKETYNLLKQAEKGEVKSYVQDIALSVMDCRETARSREDFIKQMNERGYGVDWQDSHKYITFTELKKQNEKLKQDKLNAEQEAEATVSSVKKEYAAKGRELDRRIGEAAKQSAELKEERASINQDVERRATAMYQSRKKELDSKFKAQSLSYDGFVLGLLLYGVLTTVFTAIRSEQFVSDFKAFFIAIGQFLVNAFQLLLKGGQWASQLGDKIPQPVVATIVHYLLLIVFVGGIGIGVGVLIFLGASKVFEFYTDDYADTLSLAVFLISLAVSVYFAEPIRAAIPINLLLLLILVHIVYVLIRWYVKGCKRSRGYY